MSTAAPAPVTPHVLDNPAWASLSGPHAAFAERAGAHASPAGPAFAARYAPDVAPFSALADPADPRSWEALRSLAGAGGVVSLSGVLTPPAGWETVGAIEGVQLVDVALRAEPAPEAVRLGPGDVPEVLELIALTKPGPFLPRTVELGTYLGIRHQGRLVAMAGERLRPPGWTEISAVCTRPDHRGRGLATRLVRAVAAGIRDRGDVPFLHTAAHNTAAVRLYESIGFAVRRRPTFMALRAPDAPHTPPIDRKAAAS
ncbi:GNAT family N-acetyltransferase [Streptomyces sp. NBC_00249]|uniref:GNAT family N-acetyltransferase n=1 Tax=Streptomyces sp. NBC_00249 TaxID=2975690 RepID=UPI00224EB1CC|nr:GNAT family N-acetyltransferase [Streptomyces sp. NBC_00249]MCX5195404.1 GNAT family N-acetyltransferase [Streptomyces sp. NBC_00249]